MRYILYHFKKPCPQLTAALQMMMEETHLNFSRGLGFRNRKVTPHDQVMHYKMRAPVSFPVEVADHVLLVKPQSFTIVNLVRYPKA